MHAPLLTSLNTEITTTITLSKTNSPSDESITITNADNGNYNNANQCEYYIRVNLIAK